MCSSTGSSRAPSAFVSRVLTRVINVCDGSGNVAAICTDSSYTACAFVMSTSVSCEAVKYVSMPRRSASTCSGGTMRSAMPSRMTATP